MKFSDSTNLDGLVQTFEFWAKLPYGSTGNQLKEITARINRGFDSLMPLVLSYTDHIRWDDTNHTDAPIGYINIVSGQNDYKITEDDNSLDILNLTRMRIKTSSSTSTYTEIERMYVTDDRALDAMSPNPSVSGIPTHFLEKGSVYYLYPEPNFAATSGIEIFFEREQSYFASTDTTKEPGIPKPFHEMLALHAALDWIMVNRPTDTITIQGLQGRINKKEQQLSDLISFQNPTRRRMTTAYGGTVGNESGRIGGYSDSNR